MSEIGRAKGQGTGQRLGSVHSIRLCGSHHCTVYFKNAKRHQHCGSMNFMFPTFGSHSKIFLRMGYQSENRSIAGKGVICWYGFELWCRFWSLFTLSESLRGRYKVQRRKDRSEFYFKPGNHTVQNS